MLFALAAAPGADKMEGQWTVRGQIHFSLPPETNLPRVQANNKGEHLPDAANRKRKAKREGRRVPFY